MAGSPSLVRVMGGAGPVGGEHPAVTPAPRSEGAGWVSALLWLS